MAHHKQRQTTDKRLKAILRAFAGSPTPPKEIPTKEGESRAPTRKKPKRKRRSK